MPEILSNLYLRHSDPKAHKSLLDVFETLNAWRGEDDPAGMGATVAAAEQVNPEEGRAFVEALAEHFERSGPAAEHAEEKAGLYAGHYVHRRGGEEVVPALILFAADLFPGVEAWAWTAPNNPKHPRETFLRLQDGEIWEEPYEPFQDEDEDEEAIRSGAYAWWHEDLPEEIQDGWLHREDDLWESDEIDEWDDDGPDIVDDEEE